MAGRPRVGFWTAEMDGSKSHGIRVYTRELTRALRDEVELIELGSREGPGLRRVPRWRLHPWARRWAIPSWLATLDLDVIHFPSFPSFDPSGRWRARKVITVHGAVGAGTPERAGDPRVRAKTRLARSVLSRDYDRVITVSEAARAEICGWYGLAAERIDVVHNGVAPEFFAARSLSRPAALPVPGPFLMSVGQLRRKKNVPRLIAAFAQLVRRGVPHHLAIVGPPADDLPAVRTTIAAHGIAARVHLLGHLPLDTLIALYTSAELVVQPTLHEGFGLPVAEALACGTAVACSDIPPLREVAGDSAAYFDPRNTDHMAATIGGLLADAGGRRRLAELGRQRAEVFSWQASAARLRDVYERLSSSVDRRAG